MQKTQKKKREKHVFSSPELCHRFMHRLQESGKRSDGRMHFEGDTLYSYGWYPIGVHTNKRLNGKPVFLLTRDTYSPSTAGHINYLWSAIPKKDLFVLHLERAGDIPYSIRVLFERIETAKTKQSHFKKALVRFKYEGEVSDLIAEIDTIKKIFPKEFTPEQRKALAKFRRGLMPEKELSKGLSEYQKTLRDRAEAKIRRERERYEVRQKEATDAGFNSIWEYECHLGEVSRNAANLKTANDAGFATYDDYLADQRRKRQAEELEEFESWTRGEQSYCPSSFLEDENEFTRAIIAKGEFRTSLGIHIPVAVFLRLYNNFTSGNVKVGTTVLDFPVKEITDTYIRIGCHTLGLVSLADLAKTINS